MMPAGMAGQVSIRSVVGAVRTCLPFAAPPRMGRIGASARARYTYSVWLRHLVLCAEHGLPTQPKRVVELGPGASLGAGFAAILTGSENYTGLDAVPYVEPEQLIAQFDAVAMLVEARTDIPHREFPKARPLLRSYAFPSAILPETQLLKSCTPERIAELRFRLAAGSDGLRDGPLRYCSWHHATRIAAGSADLVFSQAVMQDVAELGRTYGRMAEWLAPGGIMSHQVDFDCQRLAAQWNGYWAISQPMWRLIRARRPYILNRQPLSRHLQLLREAGMEIVAVEHVTDPSGIGRQELHRDFRWITDDDLVTHSAHVLARKPAL